MHWILILVLTTPNGVAIHSTEFLDRAACMSAGKYFTDASANDGWRASWSCSPKGSS